MLEIGFDSGWSQTGKSNTQGKYIFRLIFKKKERKPSHILYFSNILRHDRKLNVKKDCEYCWVMSLIVINLFHCSPFQLIMSRRRIPCLDSFLDKVCNFRYSYYVYHWAVWWWYKFRTYSIIGTRFILSNLLCSLETTLFIYMVF